VGVYVSLFAYRHAPSDDDGSNTGIETASGSSCVDGFEKGEVQERRDGVAGSVDGDQPAVARHPKETNHGGEGVPLSRRLA